MKKTRTAASTGNYGVWERRVLHLFASFFGAKQPYGVFAVGLFAGRYWILKSQ
jgi:hypothetical protein